MRRLLPVCAGALPALKAELVCDAFSIGRGSNPGADIRGRESLRIGPAVNRVSVSERRGFVRSSG